MATPSPTELLTVREAAQIYKVTPESIRRRIRAGTLPACKLSQRALRIRRSDLDALAVPVATSDALEAHITKIVAAAPPLSPEQRDRLSMLFRSSGDAA